MSSYLQTWASDNAKTLGRNSVAPFCLLLTLVYFGSTTHGVWDVDNLLNVAGQAAPLGIVAIGQLVVILTRGFDISVGSVAALAVVASAISINAIGPWGALAGPLAGLACGAINGIIIGRFRIQPIVATLGMLSAARGGAILLSGQQGVLIKGTNPLVGLGYERLGRIPYSFLALLLLAALVAFVLRKLRFGRRLYMIGSNPAGAQLSGVDVRQTLLVAYSISGLSAGLAALVFLGRAGIGLPTEGGGLELSAIAAVVIGGASLSGAIGRPTFVLLGALFIQFLGNGLNLAGTSPFEQQIVLGLVLVAAGLIDFAVNRAAKAANLQKGTQ